MPSSAKQNSPAGPVFDSLTRFFDTIDRWIDYGEFALKRCKQLFGRAMWLGFQAAEFASFVYVVGCFIFKHVNR
jgi:hypothetical protein